LARRSLTESASLEVEGERTVILQTGATAYLLDGTRQVGRHAQGYTLALVAEDRYVHAIEVWGPVDEVEQVRPTLDQTITTMRVRP
jgi:hypothetical protein